MYSNKQPARLFISINSFSRLWITRKHKDNKHPEICNLQSTRTVTNKKAINRADLPGLYHPPTWKWTIALAQTCKRSFSPIFVDTYSLFKRARSSTFNPKICSWTASGYFILISSISYFTHFTCVPSSDSRIKTSMTIMPEWESMTRGGFKPCCKFSQEDDYDMCGPYTLKSAQQSNENSCK